MIQKKTGFEKKGKTTPKTNNANSKKVTKPLLPLKKIDFSKINQKNKSLTPLKHKKKPTKMRSQSMTDISSSDLVDFDKWFFSEKLKKEILKKYKFLETQVQTLKKKESEVGSKMNAMKKRESVINEIKNQKNKFKKEIKDDKEFKRKKLNEQKEKMKNFREFEHNRYLTFQDLNNQRREKLCELNKASQNLRRTMFNQTISNKNFMNKNMYLKAKEHRENFRKSKENLKHNQDTQKKLINKRNYDKNLTTTENLKDKCKELEKIKSKYKNILKDEQIAVTEIDHPINYMNHTFYKGDPHSSTLSMIMSSGSYIHYSPIKKRRDFFNHTPEKSFDSKRFRVCKTPVPKKKH